MSDPTAPAVKGRLMPGSPFANPSPRTAYTTSRPVTAPAVRLTQMPSSVSDRTNLCAQR